MKDDKKRFSKLVWLLILPLELTPKTAREKRWADFPDNFFGLILRKSDYLSCFGLWMRFFQQSQAKVHGQKPLPCTKTNKTYLAKHPSTYFFIGSQMVGFHGTSTYISWPNDLGKPSNEKWLKNSIKCGRGICQFSSSLTLIFWINLISIKGGQPFPSSLKQTCKKSRPTSGGKFSGYWKILEKF